MVTTAFGYSSFGQSPFGQSSVDSTITLECKETAYQAAIWYIEGLTHYKVIVDMGDEFGGEGGSAIGQVTQTGNVVQVHLRRECYIVAIYLFDTDEDLSYMHRIPEWHVDDVYPQVAGATREWSADRGILLSKEYIDDHYEIVEKPSPIEISPITLEERNNAPSLGVDQGGKKIDILIERTKVEELNN